MAGASIEATLDDAEVIAALNRLADADRTALMRDIGEYLLRTTKSPRRSTPWGCGPAWATPGPDTCFSVLEKNTPLAIQA